MPERTEHQQYLHPVRVVNDVLYSGVVHYWGFSFDETAGSKVELVLRNGSVTGDVLAFVNINANASANMSYAKPIQCTLGLFIEDVSGAFQGMVYV